MVFIPLLVFFLLAGVFYGEDIQYEEKIKVIYIIYEGFYETGKEASSQLDLLRLSGFKGMELITKKVDGVIKYGIKILETDSYEENRKMTARLKMNRFGAVVYQRKETYKVPVAKADEPKVGPDGKIIKPSPVPLKPKIIPKAELIAKATKERKAVVISSAGLTLICSLLSGYYYGRTASFHDDYLASSDRREINSLWNSVQVNDERYKAYLAAGTAFGTLAVYELFFGKRYKQLRKAEIKIRERGNTLCLNLSFRF